MIAERPLPLIPIRQQLSEQISQGLNSLPVSVVNSILHEALKKAA
jgi:hypothetical protein